MGKVSCCVVDLILKVLYSILQFDFDFNALFFSLSFFFFFIPFLVAVWLCASLQCHWMMCCDVIIDNLCCDAIIDNLCCGVTVVCCCGCAARFTSDISSWRLLRHQHRIWNYSECAWNWQQMRCSPNENGAVFCDNYDSPPPPPIHCFINTDDVCTLFGWRILLLLVLSLLQWQFGSLKTCCAFYLAEQIGKCCALMDSYGIVWNSQRATVYQRGSNCWPGDWELLWSHHTLPLE